jgi:hypothetical protein
MRSFAARKRALTLALATAAAAFVGGSGLATAGTPQSAPSSSSQNTSVSALGTPAPLTKDQAIAVASLGQRAYWRFLSAEHGTYQKTYADIPWTIVPWQLGHWSMNRPGREVWAVSFRGMAGPFRAAYRTTFVDYFTGQYLGTVGWEPSFSTTCRCGPVPL